MNEAEGQKTWGWPVVLYVFLAGLGGGSFLLSFLLVLFGRYAPVARIGSLAAPLLVLAGSGMLVLDLGSPTRAFRLFTTSATFLTSWMIRGAWILFAFVIAALAFALPSFALFDWLPWRQASGLGFALGVAAAILSLFVTVYPGLLLGVIKSIPLWNTSALPPLFFLSGLDTGAAILVFVSLPLASSLGADFFHLLGVVDGGLIVLLLVALGAYVEIVRQTGVVGAASVHLLARPLFLGGAVVSGLLVPLALLFVSLATSDIETLRWLDGSAGFLALIGGLLLRWGVIGSGVRIAVR